MSALLKKAIRDVSEKVNDAVYHYENSDLDATALREARDLLRVLSNIVSGMDAKKAFGAPGDWGYGNDLGQGVLQMLNAQSTQA